MSTQPIVTRVLISIAVMFCGWLYSGQTLTAQDDDNLPEEVPVNQTLDGAVFGLAQDIKEFLNNDRLLGPDTKIRLDRISSDGIPDGNYDNYFSEYLTRLLAANINNSSKLLLKVEYAYLVSKSETNRGLRIIQITAELKERGSTKHAFPPREVNNTSDINRIFGNTLMPPVFEDENPPAKTASEDGRTQKVKQQLQPFIDRLNATETATENPSFQPIEATQIAASTDATYTVEIRRRAGGEGPFLPVSPSDQGGLAFVPLDIKDTYHVVLYNYDKHYDAVARVEIDGLDVISTFLEDRDSKGNKLKYPGYFIPRATEQGPGVHVVPGWLRTVAPGEANVFDFVVNEFGKGAASELKAQGNTGVISVQFFDACPPDGKLRSRSFGETGKGEARRQDYQTVPIQVGSEPVAIISLRYSRKPE